MIEILTDPRLGTNTKTLVILAPPNPDFESPFLSKQLSSSQGSTRAFART